MRWADRDGDGAVGVADAEALLAELPDRRPEDSAPALLAALRERPGARGGRVCEDGPLKRVSSLSEHAAVHGRPRGSWQCFRQPGTL